jgi:hypothetical protein
MMEDVGDALKDTNGFIGYFRTDAIARKDGEFEEHGGLDSTLEVVCFVSE